MSDWHGDEAKAECLDLRIKVRELEAGLADLERQLAELRETAQAVVVHRHIPHGAHVDLPKLARDIDKMEEVLKDQDKAGST